MITSDEAVRRLHEIDRRKELIDAAPWRLLRNRRLRAEIREILAGRR